MQPVLLGEYRNQNGRRNYPFADDATLKDSTGTALPLDFIIDACICPVTASGILYVSRIDAANFTIYVSDADGIKGTAVYSVGNDYAWVYEYRTDTVLTYDFDADATFRRQIGVLVFGDSAAGMFQGAANRLYDIEATPLCPTAVVGVTTHGVTGVIGDDGLRVTGAVVIDGDTGIVTRSFIESGRKILEIDVVGVEPPEPEDCGLPPPIKQMCFERAVGSTIDLSQYNTSTAALQGHGFCLEDLCASQRALQLPDANGKLPLSGDDVCSPPTPPGPPPPDVETQFCIEPEDTDSSINILAPSLPGCANAVTVRPLDPQGLVAPTRLPGNLRITDQSDLDEFMRKVNNPAFEAQGIEIKIRGLPKSQGSKRGH